MAEMLELVKYQMKITRARNYNLRLKIVFILHFPPYL